MVLIMLFTVTDVFLRYVFSRPIAATMEFAGFMMVIMTFSALAWCALTDKHVKVDLIVGRFSPRAQEVLKSLNYLVAIFVSVLVGLQAFRVSILVRQAHEASELTKIPFYPFYWVITFGFALMFLVTITLLVRSVVKAVKG